MSTAEATELTDATKVPTTSTASRPGYPVGPMLYEVTVLQTYHRHAREVAQRVRSIAKQFPTRPVVA